MSNEKMRLPQSEVIRADELEIVEPRMDQKKESNEPK